MAAHLALLLALFVPLAAGCAAQREPAENAPAPPGPPRPVVLFGTWEVTLAGEGEPLSGVLSIPDEGEGHFTASSGLDAPVRLARVDVTGQTFRISGAVQAEGGPLPILLTGIIEGDRMAGEVELGGVAYQLEARRVREE